MDDGTTRAHIPTRAHMPTQTRANVESDVELYSADKRRLEPLVFETRAGMCPSQ